MKYTLYYIYIITNSYNTTYYIGITSNLQRRIFEHKQGLIEGFSKKYKLWKLVWFEESNDINEVINKEKQMKNWHRKWKINLIKHYNSEFKDLAQDWYENKL